MPTATSFDDSPDAGFPEKKPMKTARAIAAALVLLAAALAWAAGSRSAGQPSRFEITILKVELKNEAGEWVKIIEPDRRVDLAQEEAMVAFFNNDGRVPFGSYVNFRVTISETITFAGHQGKHFTKKGGDCVLGGSAKYASELPGPITSYRERTTTWNSSGEGDVKEKFNFDREDSDEVIEIYGRDNFPPIEVRPGAYVGVWFDIPIEDTVFHANPGEFGASQPSSDAMYLVLPSRVTEARVTVGTKTLVIDGKEILVSL